MHKYKNLFDNISTPFFVLLIIKREEGLSFDNTISEMSYDSRVLKMAGINKLGRLKHFVTSYGVLSTLKYYITQSPSINN